MRYRKPISAFYVPSGDALLVDGYPVLSPEQVDRYTTLLEELQDFYEDEYDRACQHIEEARKKGILPENEGGRDPYRARARELLRGAVPVAAYSDVYWTVNLRSLLNFFSLRTKATAQYEIREYALRAYTLFGRRFPIIREMIEKAEKEQ
jgi:thymidylate synthase (FAD)